MMSAPDLALHQGGDDAPEDLLTVCLRAWKRAGSPLTKSTSAGRLSLERAIDAFIRSTETSKDHGPAGRS